MKNPFIQHLIAIVVFIFIACVFCYPALQENLFSAGDTTHWKCMSQEAREWAEKTGGDPMWSNSMFGGMPTATYYSHANTNLVLKIQEAFQNFFPSPIYFFLLAMISFYILAISMKWNRLIGVIGAITYAFASYNIQITVAGHATKMLSIGYIPLVLAGMNWVYTKKYILGTGVALLGLSLMLSNTMYQIVYYFIFIIVAFGIGYLVQAIKENTLKEFFISSAIMLVVAILSLGPSINGFLYTKEYSKTTMRGGQSEVTIGKDKKTNGGLDKDYAFQWSQGIGETFTLFVPNLYGGGNQTDVGKSSHTFDAVSSIAGEETAENFSKHASTYWGPQPFLAGPVYFGIIVMLLMVLSLFIIKNNFKWIVFGLGIFGIMLSWGKHFSGFNYFLFDHLPMYNNFRTPSMAMTIAGVAFCILAIWALNEFFKEREDHSFLLNAVKKSVIITGAICLLFGVGSTMFMSFKGENDDKLKSQFIQMVGNNEQAGTTIFNAIVDDRSGLALKDGMRSIVFVLLAGLVLWFFAQRKINKNIALALVALLMAIDILSIGVRYINEENYKEKDQFETQFAPRPVDMQIKQDPDPYYRVFDFTTDPYNDAMGAYHHKMVGGYSPAKMEMFQDLIDNHLSNGKMNAQVLNMLNTKYFIFNGQNNQPTAQPNPETCGNAWFVKNIKIVNTANDEITSLKAPSIGDTAKIENPFVAKEMAIVQQKFWKNNPTQFIVDSTAKVKLTKYELNDLAFESSNTQNGYAVFADIYYNNGWKAYIDGKEAEIVKTNYLLRGLHIPAGNHKITFEYRPQSYIKYAPYAKISSILILLILIAGIGLVIKDEIKKEK